MIAPRDLAIPVATLGELAGFTAEEVARVAELPEDAVEILRERAVFFGS